MELIYSMRRKPLKCEPPHFETASDSEVIRPICVISSRNVIAFSSPTDLSDIDGDSWGGYVYICDLDTPWDSHKVTSTTYPVTVLEWDSEGRQLLVATTVGDVTVFGQKDYLLNEWICLYTANFPGEHIIKSVFFHNGRRVVAVDKKPDSPITDRIQLLRSTPTLKGFGGIACEGACIVTATGLLGAITPAAAADCQAVIVTECLRATRDHITCASFAHKNGNLLIAAVCGSSGQDRSCVRCFVCSASRAAPPAPPAPPARPPPARAALAVQPLPSIYIDGLPTSITWSLREDTDSLLIAGSTLTLWKLTERSHPVHKLFSKGPLQGSSTPGGGQKPVTDCFNTVVWQQAAAWPVESSFGSLHVTSCRLPVTPHAVLAAPRALHLLARDNHHYLGSVPVVTAGLNDSSSSGSASKKMKYGAGYQNGAGCAMVCSADMSWLGGVVVTIDSHTQLHVYKLPQPWHEIPTPLAVQHATTLLEYAMVASYDCLDILMTLKPGLIDAVYDRVTESFQRQPQTFQQYYFHSWLKLRIAICRLSSSAVSTVSSLTCLQTLHTVWAASGAALRYPPDDRPEFVSLASLLDEHSHSHTHTDHDKTLLALEAKPDLPSEPLVLQALRRPLQRAVDIAVTVLAAVAANSSGHHQPHGYELWSDPVALTLLRKILIIVRLCGRVGDALSRPLARLCAAPPKPDLLEECAALSAQMPTARVWEALSRCSVSAPHGKIWPLYMEYGVEPDFLRFVCDPPAYAQCDTTPSSAMDSIRYMYLGGGTQPAKWRQCSRCGARALPAAHPAKHPLQRAHDARFLLACRCGGSWTLFSNV